MDGVKMLNLDSRHGWPAIEVDHVYSGLSTILIAMNECFEVGRCQARALAASPLRAGGELVWNGLTPALVFCARDRKIVGFTRMLVMRLKSLTRCAPGVWATQVHSHHNPPALKRARTRTALCIAV